MLEKYLTKEEKVLFSKKRMNKIKKSDFLSYIKFYEDELSYLKGNYDPKVFKNPITEKNIKDLEEYLEELNTYYYEHILPDPKGDRFMNEMAEVESEFKDFEDFINTMEREATREIEKLHLDKKTK